MDSLNSGIEKNSNSDYTVRSIFRILYWIQKYKTTTVIYLRKILYNKKMGTLKTKKIKTRSTRKSIFFYSENFTRLFIKYMPYFMDALYVLWQPELKLCSFNQGRKYLFGLAERLFSSFLFKTLEFHSFLHLASCKTEV